MPEVFKCKYPWSPAALRDGSRRCRQCGPCRRWLQSEWTSRLLLEAVSNPSWPFFITLTYSDERVPSIQEASGYARRFPQYLREQGLTVRYFLCTELGSKTSRVHHHAICWIPQWNGYSDKTLFQMDRSKIWPYGHSSVSAIRKVGAFRYVTKYVQKSRELPTG